MERLLVAINKMKAAIDKIKLNITCIITKYAEFYMELIYI